MIRIVGVGAFFLVGDDYRILRVHTLLDDIADDVGLASVRHIDLVRTRTILVSDPVIQNVGFGGAGLDQMSND